MSIGQQVAYRSGQNHDSVRIGGIVVHRIEVQWATICPGGPAQKGVAAIVKSSNEQWASASDKGRESIGPRLRHIRQEKRMTVEALAAAAGLDKGFLSRLERGAKQPSVATVLRLSAALEVPVGRLFGEQTTEDMVRISRASGRRRSEEGAGYSFELVTPRGGLMEGFLFEAGPESVGPGQQHDGEEMFIVLAGMIEMRTPDRSYVLETGDCAYFPGHLAHSMRRIGPETARAIIAVARSQRSKTPLEHG
jgi:transcriptional regulator with XRE-family HTH domain